MIVIPPVQASGSLRLLVNPTWQDLLSFTLSLAGVISFLIIVVLLGRLALSGGINIELMAVPKTLAEEEYTSEVAARRFQDEMGRVLFPSQLTPLRTRQPPAMRPSSERDIDVLVTSERLPAIALKSDLPTAVVPGFGVSLDTLAVLVPRLLRLEPTSHRFGRIHGHRPKAVASSPREPSHDLANAEGGNPDEPDKLLAKAALSVLDATEPRLGAIAHNNLGNAKDREGKSDEAAAER